MYFKASELPLCQHTQEQVLEVYYTSIGKKRRVEQANNKGKKKEKKDSAKKQETGNTNKRAEEVCWKAKEKGKTPDKCMPRSPSVLGPRCPRDQLRGASGGPFGQGAGEGEPGTTWALCTGLFLTTKHRGEAQRVPGLM